MGTDALHDLTPAYALDALDDAERRDYESHLATCERCRAELATFEETAAALAYANVAPAPPDALGSRILEQVRAERARVVPLRRTRATYALGAAATLAAGVALAVGVWAVSVARTLDEQREALRVLADPQARSIALPEEFAGRLVVRPDGDAALVVSSSPPAPGRTYQIWVFEGEQPASAGLFGGGRQIVRLSRPVPPGAAVAVTVEREGGVEAPTADPLFVVEG